MPKGKMLAKFINKVMITKIFNLLMGVMID